MPVLSETALPVRDIPFGPRLSWGAIFAGVALALAVELMLGLLGAGVGFSFVDPAGDGTPSAGGFGIGALIWWALSTVIAIGAGGYGAVRAAGVDRSFDGAVHGLAIWAVTLLVTFYLLTSAVGGIVGGAFKAIGGVASAAGQGVGAVVPTVAQAAGIDQGNVDDQVSALIYPAPADPTTMSREESRKAILAEMPTLARGGDEGRAAEGRIADIIAAQDHLSHDVALARVEQARQRFITAKAKVMDGAKSAGGASAGVAAGTSFTAFVVLLLGAAAGVAGGRAAARRRLIL